MSIAAARWTSWLDCRAWARLGRGVSVDVVGGLQRRRSPTCRWLRWPRPRLRKSRPTVYLSKLSVSVLACPSPGSGRRRLKKGVAFVVRAFWGGSLGDEETGM